MQKKRIRAIAHLLYVPAMRRKLNKAAFVPVRPIVGQPVHGLSAASTARERLRLSARGRGR